MSRAFGTPSTVTRNDPDLSCVALNEWFNKRWTSRWSSECSSPVPWFPPCPGSHPHTTVYVGKGLRWCIPHLNALTNTFLDIWGLLYACSLLFAHVSPSCWSSILVIVFQKPPHTDTFSLQIMPGTVVVLPLMFKPWENTVMPLVKMYAFMINTLHQTRNSQAFVSWSI